MTTSYQTARPVGNDVRTDHGEFFLWGLVGEKTVDLTALCPSGVKSFQSQFSPTDVLVQAVTCGLVAPTTIEVRCASGSSFQMTPVPTAYMTRVVPQMARQP